jgi:hypothetical protein
MILKYLEKSIPAGHGEKVFDMDQIPRDARVRPHKPLLDEIFALLFGQGIPLHNRYDLLNDAGNRVVCRACLRVFSKDEIGEGRSQCPICGSELEILSRQTIFT